VGKSHLGDRPNTGRSNSTRWRGSRTPGISINAAGRPNPDPGRERNNGADARAAREHLKERRVDLIEVQEPQRDLAKTRVLSLGPALVIDGLFGIGLNRQLSAEWVALVQTINQAHALILAVDLPSGLNADTGEPQGAAIRATITLTVGAPKRGLLRPCAWPFVEGWRSRLKSAWRLAFRQANYNDFTRGFSRLSATA